MIAAPRATHARRAMVAACAVAATMLTGACAAGRRAATSEEVAALDGSNVTVGSIALRGLAIEAPTGNYYPVGSYPEMRLVLVNTGTTSDVLTGISTPDAGGWGVFDSAGDLADLQAGGTAPTPTTSVTIGAGNRASFGVPDSSKVLALLKTKRQLYPSAGVKVTFSFGREGSVTATVPVEIASAPGTQVIEAPSSGSDG